MRNAIQLILAGGALLAGVSAALAQVEGDNPPTAQILVWGVDRPNPPVLPTEWIPQPPGDPPVYGPGDSRDNIEGVGNKNIGAFLHHELDMVTVVFRIEDLDWQTEQGEEQQEVDEGVFLRVRIWADPWQMGSPPNVPPIPEASDVFFGEGEEGFKPLVIGETYRDVAFTFYIPEFNGKNQARLRGIIDWDVRWWLTVEASNDQSPEEAAITDAVGFVAIESPGLGPPNSPPFADAGPDRTVPAGFEVLLDGSRTFDAFNVGFDAYDENIYEKDFLTFTWEWISGPVRVDPVQTDPSDPTATVTLSVPDPSEPYIFRLIVDDNVRALPSSDTVAITVVEELPGMNPPLAIIEGPASARPVGSIVTLVSRSTDPDRPDDPNGVLLDYRWQQTNELGGPLTAEELQDAFLPLSGMTEKVSTWQALSPGTFYFRLLVDDGDFRSSATFSVEVIGTATGGATETLDGTGEAASNQSGQQQGFATPGGLCGAGILPLAALPPALCVLRRRMR